MSRKKNDYVGDTEKSLNLLIQIGELRSEKKNELRNPIIIIEDTSIRRVFSIWQTVLFRPAAKKVVGML